MCDARGSRTDNRCLVNNKSLQCSNSQVTLGYTTRTYRWERAEKDPSIKSRPMQTQNIIMYELWQIRKQTRKQTRVQQE